ncbi:hypothetical protein D3C76_940740 [compost metagenome]
MLVDLIGHDHGDTPQAIDGRGQYVIAITQQPTHLAAAHHIGDVDRRTVTIHDDRGTGRIRRVGRHAQFVDSVTHHQWLAVTQVDIHAPFGIGDLGAHQLIELADGFVTLVQQLVGRATRTTDFTDFLVVRRNGRRQLVDLVGHRTQLIVDVSALLLQLPGDGIEAAAQALGVGQQGLARGVVVGTAGQGLHGRKERLQGLGHTGTAVGQQLVHLGGLPQIGLRITVEGGRGLQLRVEVAVVHPTHVGQRSTGANEHIAVPNGVLGTLHSLLARVPDGIDVGNVVTGSHQ